MKLQFKIFLFVLLFIIACFSCGYVGYLFNEYKHQELKIDKTLKDFKKTNAVSLKKTDSTLLDLSKRQSATIDSLLKLKVKSKDVNISSGFTMGGKSISTEELLRYVNDLYKESNYYKQLYETLSKKYNIQSKQNDDGTVTLITKDPKLEEVVNQFNTLQGKYTNLSEKYATLNKESIKCKDQLDELKIALKLIKENYDIDYSVRAKNDSTNIISVDKIKKKKNK